MRFTIPFIIMMICMIISPNFGHTQDDELEILAVNNKKVVQNSKQYVKDYLLVLKDSLSLGNKETKIRKITIQPTMEALNLIDEANDFQKSLISLKTPVYQCEHRTRRKGSHYKSIFQFDVLGDLIFAETNFVLVVY